VWIEQLSINFTTFYPLKNENYGGDDTSNWRFASTAAPRTFTFLYNEHFFPDYNWFCKARLNLSIASFRPRSNVLIGLYISRYKITQGSHLVRALWAYEIHKTGTKGEGRSLFHVSSRTKPIQLPYWISQPLQIDSKSTCGISPPPLTSLSFCQNSFLDCLFFQMVPNLYKF